jgi:hypothetical protein
MGYRTQYRQIGCKSGGSEEVEKMEEVEEAGDVVVLKWRVGHRAGIPGCRRHANLGAILFDELRDLSMLALNIKHQT